MTMVVSHHCFDPCRAAQCRAHSVAANVAGVLRYTPHAPPVAPILPPPLSMCVAGKSPCNNGSRYTGVSQLHSHQSHYTVPLIIKGRVRNALVLDVLETPTTVSPPNKFLETREFSQNFQQKRFAPRAGPPERGRVLTELTLGRSFAPPSM